MKIGKVSQVIFSLYLNKCVNTLCGFRGLGGGMEGGGWGGGGV